MWHLSVTGSKVNVPELYSYLNPYFLYLLEESDQKFYIFGGKKDASQVVDVSKKHKSSCKKAIPYPKVKHGYTVASFTVEKTTITCGGKLRFGPSLSECRRLTNGSWIAAGNLRIGRDMFTITPLTRTSFLAYGNLYNVICLTRTKSIPYPCWP